MIGVGLMTNSCPAATSTQRAGPDQYDHRLPGIARLFNGVTAWLGESVRYEDPRLNLLSNISHGAHQTLRTWGARTTILPL